MLPPGVPSSSFYEDAPFVVQLGSAKGASESPIPESLSNSLSTKCSNGETLKQSSLSILQLWSAEKEARAWGGLPELYSRNFQHVLRHLDGSNETVSRWLATRMRLHHGKALPPRLAEHVAVLLRLWVCAAAEEASALLASAHLMADDPGERREGLSVPCPALHRGAQWVAGQLALVTDSDQAHHLPLAFLKHLVADAATCRFSGGRLQGEGRAAGAESDAAAGGMREVEQALAALRDYRALHGPDSNAAVSVELYDKWQREAAQERALRSDWQPLGEGRGGRDAERLAQERDLKRRRLKYRSRRPKRSPLQVLHDMIEKHTAAIALAGGIGASYAHAHSRCEREDRTRRSHDTAGEEPCGSRADATWQQARGSRSPAAGSRQREREEERQASARWRSGAGEGREHRRRPHRQDEVEQEEEKERRVDERRHAEHTHSRRRERRR
eukprot:jgi/Mesen1/975/ME000012S00539